MRERPDPPPPPPKEQQSLFGALTAPLPPDPAPAPPAAPAPEEPDADALDALPPEDREEDTPAAPDVVGATGRSPLPERTTTPPPPSLPPPQAPAGARAYQVFALKYRPRRFADLVGQEHVTRTLCNALRSGRVAHAFLLCGSRGVGKTTTARILAKALNCPTARTDVEPCGACDVCRAIDRGDDLDVREIDGASNNGVDQVRDLRERATLRPARARWKIYIVDEVHMLTTAAFNALLKTLEEPPAHVKFIFATTEPHKVLDTIVSRCQRYDFRRLGTDEIAAHLATLCAREGFTAEPDALRLCAAAAQGGMRDAQSMLDRVLAFGAEDGRLTAEAAARGLGLAGPAVLRAVFTAVREHRGAELLATVARLEADGLDLAQFAEDLARLFQNVLRARFVGADADLFDEPEDVRRWLADQAQQVAPDTLMLWADLLLSALARMRVAETARWHLELALLRMAESENLAALDELLERLMALEARLGGPGGAAPGAGGRGTGGSGAGRGAGSGAGGSTGAPGGAGETEGGGTGPAGGGPDASSVRPRIESGGGRGALPRAPAPVEGPALSPSTSSEPALSASTGSGQALPKGRTGRGVRAPTRSPAPTDADAPADAAALWALALEALRPKNALLHRYAAQGQAVGLTSTALQVAFAGEQGRRLRAQAENGRSALEAALAERAGRPLGLELFCRAAPAGDAAGSVSVSPPPTPGAGPTSVLDHPVFRKARALFGGEVWPVADGANGPAGA